MVDDEINLAERVDLGGLFTHLGHCSSHGSEVNNGWYTREILQNNSSRLERDLHTFWRVVLPVKDGLNVRF